MTDYEQKVASLNEQIAKLKHQIEIEQHRYVRQKNSLKGKRQIAKERNHRMIFCIGRIEYHLKNRLNIAADEFNDLTDGEVRAMVDEAFADIRVCDAIRQIFAKRREAKDASPAGETQQS